jgi:hypothetical protein
MTASQPACCDRNRSASRSRSGPASWPRGALNARYDQGILGRLATGVDVADYGVSENDTFLVVQPEPSRARRPLGDIGQQRNHDCRRDQTGEAKSDLSNNGLLRGHARHIGWKVCFTHNRDATGPSAKPWKHGSKVVFRHEDDSRR